MNVDVSQYIKEGVFNEEIIKNISNIKYDKRDIEDKIYMI